MVVPEGVVTEMVPLVAEFGTVAETWSSSVTLNDALLPLNFTAVAPVNPVPVLPTFAPIGPEVGVKLAIVGGGKLTVKFVVEVAVPPGVVTVIFPVTAPAGTLVAICVALVTVNVAAFPATTTLLTPVKFVPVIVMAAPTAPLAGEKLEIVGKAGVGGGGAWLLFVLPPPPQPKNASKTRLPPAVFSARAIITASCGGLKQPHGIPLKYSPDVFTPVSVQKG